MRKQTYLLMLFIAISACTEEQPYNSTQNDSAITFVATKNSDNFDSADAVSSKAAKNEFQTGDKMLAFIETSADQNHYANSVFTVGNDGKLTSSPAINYPNSGGAIDVYSFYPSDLVGGDELSQISFAEKYASISTDQKEGSSSPAIDVLYTSVKGQTDTGNPILLAYDHVFAKFSIKLSSESTATVTGINIVGTKTKISYTFTKDGGLTAIADESVDITPIAVDLKPDTYVEALVCPQNLTEGSNLIEFVTTSGNKYFKVNSTLTKIEAGKNYNFDITVNEEEITDNGRLLTTDLAVTVGPEITYKRGTAGPGMGGFYDTNTNRKFIDDIASRGVNVFVGCHNYYREETPKYNELYNWDTGEYKAEICDLFVDIRVQAYRNGLEMVNIMGSCPKGYRVDPEYKFNDIDQPLPDDEMIEGETESPMQVFQRVLPDYIKKTEEEIGRKLGISDYHAIWCGSDEPAHSIGDPIDLPEGESLSTEDKKANITRYIKFWEPIEKAIHTNGGKVGGLQLNSANSDLYDYTVDEMQKYNLKLDYLTFIFYQFGKEKDIVNAIAAVNSYNQKFNANAKMILLRGDYKKNENISFCRYLIGEKLFMENADKIHSYSLDCSTNYSSINANPTEWDCRFWIMTQLGNRRHSIENLPGNIDGFVTTKENKVIAALWNFKDINNDGICDSSSPRTLTLELQNGNISDNAQLKIRRFKACDPVTKRVKEITTNAQWDKAKKRIVNIVLDADEFVLIEIGDDDLPSSGDTVISDSGIEIDNVGEWNKW